MALFSTQISLIYESHSNSI
uniref:Uncharacterized protein n=1 Tax=Anguilla anguilla TaxID=7936 RepID=A0A0E9TYH7_ANGAN